MRKRECGMRRDNDGIVMFDLVGVCVTEESECGIEETKME